jgi:hypothetical protein
MIMKRTTTTLALALAVLAAAACSSSEENTGSGDTGGNATAGKCPADNPNCREAATAKAGEVAAQRRKCGDCHDSAQGKMAGSTVSLAKESGVELYAPNLTPDNDTGIGTWTDDQLAFAIRSGYDKDGLQLCPQMQHNPDMSDFEVYSLVMYLKSLPAVTNKILSSVCPPLKSKAEQT